MMNIFFSFNPFNYLIFSFIFINLLIFNFPGIFFINKNSLLKLKMSNFLIQNFKNNSMLSMKFFISMFFFLSLINLFNLLPFSFSFNSNLNMFFFLSFNFWISIFLFSLFFYFNNLIIHLTPSGCPMILSFFMVLIEMVSILIRPITLSVRMSANLLAGHLLIHLFSEFSFFLMNINFTNFIFCFILIIILNFLEIGVSVIQAYIFCTLINMYLIENIE